MKPLLLAIIGLVIVLLLGGALFAVYRVLQSGGNQQTNISLTVWGIEDQALYQKTFSNFMKDHPGVSVIYKQQPAKFYVARIRNRAGDVPQGERPDIVLIHNTWTSMFEDLLTPLPQDILSTQQYDKLFYPSATSSLKRKDVALGLPTSTNGLVLLYNTSMFAAKNFAPPADWESFLTAATRLTQRDDAGNLTVAGAAIGTATNVTYFSDILGLMFVQQDNTPISKLGSQETKPIAQYYVKFAQGPERVWDSNQPQDIDAFAQQKVAMIFGTAQTIADLKAKNPSLAFSTAPTPQLRPNDPKAWTSFWAWGVSKRATNPHLAWELAWKLTEKASLLRANTARATLGTGKLPYPRTDMAQYQANDPLFTPFYEQANYALSQPLASQIQDFSINDGVVKILHDLIVRGLFSGNGQGLQEAGNSIRDLLKQNNSSLE